MLALSLRSLGLKSVIKWNDIFSPAKSPPTFRSEPSKMYLQSGWSSYGDWLGTGAQSHTRIADGEHSKKARAFARSLKLKSSASGRVLYVRREAE